MAESAAPKRKLLQDYKLGSVIGQGAFGVVYKCTSRTTGKEYAVKLVDQVESPLPDIKRECEMLSELAHPSVMKLQNVYFEKVFVCMVLELYAGGDMMKGMVAHWKSKGMIELCSVQYLARQMWTALAWIHSRSCVHRDIKADNFMMENQHVELLSNRILLADFGTVREVLPGERVNHKCGTKHYWSPEFFALDYGLGVDVWACGVVMYGLLSGKFPYKNEQEVMTKELQFSKRVTEEAEAATLRALTRKEDKRPASAAFLQDIFIKGEGAIANKHDDQSDSNQDGMMEFGADAGVADRRRELVTRLQHASGDKLKRRGEGLQALVKDGAYTFQDAGSGRCTKFAKWPTEKAADMMSVFEKARRLTPQEINGEVGRSDIVKLLTDHKVSLENFGKGQAKPLDAFVEEIQSGQTRLLVDATKYKSLARCVDIVLVKIRLDAGDANTWLIECSEEYPDGRWRNSMQLPGDKKLPHENTRQTAMRIVHDLLNMQDCHVAFDFDNTEWNDEDTGSPSYPIRTVYRKEIVSGVVQVKDTKILERIGVKSPLAPFNVTDSREYTRKYEWMSEANRSAQQVKIPTVREHDEYSALVYSPVGLKEDELSMYLVESSIDLSQWGKGNAKSLREFSEELVKGEARLVRQPNRQVVRVVDIVVLHIKSADGKDVFVEAEEISQSGEAATRSRLPAIKRRADEHMFLAAKRLITDMLNLPENAVDLDTSDVRVLEEQSDSTSYAGLTTMYNKHFISASFRQ